MPASKAAQSFVPVQEVRNGVVILKDGAYRGILMTSSTNFSLKSEDEQRGIIGGFQSFINGLDFTVQIVVHSRKMDIRPYLTLLNERMGEQTSELMRLQLREYVSFIENFIQGSDIMTKTFYVIVPFAPGGGAEIANTLSSIGKHSTAAAASDEAFEEYRVQLEQRMSLVASGLGASGIRAVPLGTEEIIELLYHSFNISETDTPIRITDA
jgi:hypothetical protein